jgi:S1-C subfamily serine protease
MIKQIFFGFLGGCFSILMATLLLFYVFEWDGLSDQTALNSRADFAKLISEVSERSDFSLPLTQDRFSFAEAAKTATPSVVHIKAEESRDQLERRREERGPFSFDNFFNRGLSPFYRREGSGSGVIFSEDGFIITNNHVVEFADLITITLHDGRSFEATKIGSEPDADIAVLKIEAKGLPTIPWANTLEIEVGDWVLAIGNPFDYLTSTVTAGIVSAKGRDLDIAINGGRQTFTNFIQTDAAINPGNSGGALVNANGELLGINSAIATPTGVFAGYSFAIPVETVEEIVERILMRASNRSMGIEVTDMDEELAEYLNVNTTNGVLILDTESESAAEYAGLQPYDLILSVNDVQVNSVEEMESILYDDSMPEVLLLKILREGREKLVNIKLK